MPRADAGRGHGLPRPHLRRPLDLLCSRSAGRAGGTGPRAGPVDRRERARATHGRLGALAHRLRWGTAEERQVRSALSLAKLYLTEYVLRHGDGSAGDLAYGERMIRFSDDAAADAVEAKYPQAIAIVAAEYGLTETRPGANWGSSTTSTADVADFLAAKQRTEPASPIFSWMATAAPRAADGTEQNWGTATLPGVQGTKWGWADAPPQEVASASFGPGFTVAAHTRGGPADQTADVLGALSTILPGRGGPAATSVPPHTTGSRPAPVGSRPG
ncbi:hypothetical protein ABZV91_23920 [Nocardia sp. NPDC004568]|uniref:hypothetical protein n=1 Tax=Nocardia sp. NPDC004568 TaxID=3154551 RepID=UPI0033ACD718